MNDLFTATLKSQPFLRDMKPEHLDIISGCATEITLEAGRVIFCEGEPANQCYLIKTGHVVLEAGTVEIQHLLSGDVLGWSWLFPPYVWHLRARALEPTAAIVLNGARLLVMAESHHDFGYELMRRVTQVLIQRLQITRLKLVRSQIEAALEG